MDDIAKRQLEIYQAYGKFGNEKFKTFEKVNGTLDDCELDNIIKALIRERARVHSVDVTIELED